MVKKQSKSFNINIKRKDLYLLVALFVFLIGAGAIIAYGGDNPSVVGHSSGEVSGTVVGGCNYICNVDSSIFYECKGTWGDGSCTGTLNVACLDSGWNHCHCAEGTLRFIGQDYAWSSHGGILPAASQHFKYLCITP